LENQSDLHIITPSKWLMDKSKESSLFSKYAQHHIPNGIDDRSLIHQDKIKARNKLGFPADKKILLFVSDWVEREGKGFTFLHEAQNLLNPDERPLLCVAGRTNLELAGKHFIKLGFVRDEKTMSQVYSACDAYVLPSLEDNLPNTIIESLLCGTPVIAFPVGGIPEMTEHGKNGILCSDTSADSLKTAISEFLSGKYEFNNQEIRKHAIDKYGLKNQAKKYCELYKSL
ncbi:glycosyltransferase, partial [Bacteroidota bacterium]